MHALKHVDRKLEKWWISDFNNILTPYNSKSIHDCYFIIGTQINFMKGFLWGIKRGQLQTESETATNLNAKLLKNVLEQDF